MVKTLNYVVITEHKLYKSVEEKTMPNFVK